MESSYFRLYMSLQSAVRQYVKKILNRATETKVLVTDTRLNRFMEFCFLADGFVFLKLNVVVQKRNEKVKW